MREEWRAVEDYEDYEVSSRGLVRSWRKSGPGGGRRDEPVLLLQSEGEGYIQLTLISNEGRRRVYVHQLVLEAFVGPCPDGMETRHLDGDQSNNELDNLRWGTPVENAEDKARHGTASGGSQKGNDNPMAVDVSTKIAAEIKKRYEAGEAAVSIANDFPDLGYQVVRSIIRGSHWSQR